MRLEHDPIHRHKDVLTHTIAVVENVRPPRATRDLVRLPAITRLAALFHDVGKPRTRGYQPGKGTTFHHHDAVGARMTRKRMEALRYSKDDIAAVTELVALHLRFHTYQMDGPTRRCAATCATPATCSTSSTCSRAATARPATPARRPSCHSGWTISSSASTSCAEAEELAAIRPELDGMAVMAMLGIPPGRVVGEALAFLLEIRLDEGLIGEEQAGRRLREWWSARNQA